MPLLADGLHNHVATVCGVEPRNPPRWFRVSWWARQLSLVADSLAMRQVVWGYILPIADPKKVLRPDLTWHLSIIHLQEISFPATLSSKIPQSLHRHRSVVSVVLVFFLIRYIDFVLPMRLNYLMLLCLARIFHTSTLWFPVERMISFYLFYPFDKCSFCLSAQSTFNGFDVWQPTKCKNDKLCKSPYLNANISLKLTHMCTGGASSFISVRQQEYICSIHL